jgi:hypothetical protein
MSKCTIRGRGWLVATIRDNDPTRECEMKKKKKCAIVLRIDQDVVDVIDEIRDVFRMNRSQWLRKAITRNLQRNRRELRLIDRPGIRSALVP